MAAMEQVVGGNLPELSSELSNNHGSKIGSATELRSRDGSWAEGKGSSSSVPESGFTKAQRVAAELDAGVAGGQRVEALEEAPAASWRSLLQSRFARLEVHDWQGREAEPRWEESLEVDKLETGSSDGSGRKDLFEGRGSETSVLMSCHALEEGVKEAKGEFAGGMELADESYKQQQVGVDGDGRGFSEEASACSVSVEADGVKCHKCGQSFATEAALDLLHSSAKCLACKTCGRLFGSTAALGQHMSMSHGLGRFSKSANSLVAYDSVSETACLFNCHLCQRQFKSGTALFQHAAAAHSGLVSGQHPDEESGAMPDPEKPFSCRHCMKKFKTGQAAERHTRDKHKIVTGECPSTILTSLQIPRRAERPAGGVAGAAMRPLLTSRGLYMMNMPALIASGIVPQTGSEMVRAGVLHAIQHMARKEARLPMLPRMHMGSMPMPPDVNKVPVTQPGPAFAKRGVRGGPYLRTVMAAGSGQVMHVPGPAPQMMPPAMPVLPAAPPQASQMPPPTTAPAPLGWAPVYQPVMTEWGMQMSVVYQPIYGWSGQQS